jgi:RNA polymerase sigma factor (sigma-70 family)
MASKKRSLRVVGKNEPVTLDSVVHPSQVEFEDEFEALLDAEGDAEFGALELKDAAPGSKSGAKGEVLKNWTSQDFSNIYTRFRPHLERYAKRWLNNQHQVDEVVQDAFLYLMVTLPELDSEIGVLRFLKWKLRLLCLDVIRASGRAYVNNIDDHQDALISDEPEHSAALEAADDAAVVRLALSKLTPRHREVLLATMYEEKSIAEVAAQVELTENATRQLIFRARAAFKVALIGDVDTSGMSAGAILSVAARKAAQETKKVGVQAMMLALFVILGIGTFFSLGGNGTVPGSNVANPAPNSDGNVVPVPGSTDGSNSGSNSTNGTGGSGTGANGSSNGDAGQDSASNSVVDAASAAYVQPAPSESPLNVYALSAAMSSQVAEQVTVFPSNAKANTAAISSFTIQGDSKNVSATFGYNSATNKVTGITLVFTIDGVQFTAYGQNVTTELVNGHLVVTGKVLDLIDPQNVVLSNTQMSGATVTLEFTQADLTAGMQNASMTIAAAQK